MIFHLIYSRISMQFFIIIFILLLIFTVCLDIVLMISFPSLYTVCFGSWNRFILAAWKSVDFNKLKIWFPQKVSIVGFILFCLYVVCVPELYMSYNSSVVNYISR